MKSICASEPWVGARDEQGSRVACTNGVSVIKVRSTRSGCGYVLRTSLRRTIGRAYGVFGDIYRGAACGVIVLLHVCWPLTGLHALFFFPILFAWVAKSRWRLPTTKQQMPAPIARGGGNGCIAHFAAIRRPGKLPDGCRTGKFWRRS